MHPRTARGPVLVLMLFAIGLLAAAQAVAAVTPGSVARPFTVRYAINTNGDIALAANTLMTCPPGTIETQTGVACEDGQDGGLADDNYYPMDYVDVDGVAATVNSSSANLAVPPGATVLFAGLYWGAAFDQGETLPLQCDDTPRTGHAAANPAAAASAWLQAPGGSYVPVNATTFDTYTEDLGCGNPGAADERTRYQAFADVTSLVQAGGGGSYTIGNVQAGTGADRHAGWSLVVAYQDVTQPARNLTVFDGFAQVANGATTTIPVSGFRTPIDGDVNTQLGFVSYEGDINLTGDSLALNGSTLSDAVALADQLLQLRDHRPRHTGDRQVARLRQPARLRRGRVRRARGRRPEQHHERDDQAVHHRRPLPARRRLVPHGHLRPGDGAQEDRQRPQRRRRESRRRAALRDQLDQHGTLAAPTTRASTTRSRRTRASSRARCRSSTARAASPGRRPIPRDGDQAEFDAASNAVRFRIGTGAGALVPPNDGGGVIAPGQSFTVRFDVVVGAGTADGTQILNTAILSSKDAAGTDYTSIASAPAAVTVRGVPDVTIDKSHTGTFVRGAQGTFTLLVSNVGGRATEGVGRDRRHAAGRARAS